MTAPILSQAKQEYYRGFDLRVAEVLRGQPVALASLTPAERRGYEAACKAQADADTDGYIAHQAEQAATRDEQRGYDLALRGYAITACRNEAQRKGFRAAEYDAEHAAICEEIWAAQDSAAAAGWPSAAWR